MNYVGFVSVGTNRIKLLPFESSKYSINNIHRSRSELTICHVGARFHDVSPNACRSDIVISNYLTAVLHSPVVVLRLWFQELRLLLSPLSISRMQVHEYGALMEC